MVLEFSIGNFRSFNSIQTLDFRATGLNSLDEQVDLNNIVDQSGQRVLKTIGVYGPNGSGKSNLIIGLAIFRSLVRSSLESEAAMDFASEPFKLSGESVENAGFFQIQLLLDGKKYRYGFTLSPDFGVLQEWLFGPADKNETFYFKRTEQEFEISRDWFEEGYNLPMEKVRTNTLFLTFVSAYDGEIAKLLRSYIVNKITIDPSHSWKSPMRKSRGGINRNMRTNELLKEGKNELVLQWLKEAGLNYSNINLDDRNPHFEDVIVEKSVFNKDGTIIGTVTMDLLDGESDGTNKFYSYIGVLYRKFSQGGIFVSDEIDNNFHPSLLQRLMRLFNDPKVNTTGAQLLFTSHDTNLLKPELFRRDQIYFTEKSTQDSTVLYSLADLKGIRNNADFASQYLSGFYGALPILESLVGLSSDDHSDINTENV